MYDIKIIVPEFYDRILFSNLMASKVAFENFILHSFVLTSEVALDSFIFESIDALTSKLVLFEFEITY